MVTLISLAILWTPFLVTRHLQARRLRSASSAAATPVAARPAREARAGTSSDEDLLWTASDDHQLTKLLTSSAPRTPTEQDHA
jgi:hypothetical protein